MGAITPQTTYPTTTPGALGAAIAPYVSSPKLEIVLDIPDTISGSIRYHLLRWNADAAAWFPVSTGEMEVKSDPTLFGGKYNFIHDVPSPGYYVVFQRTTGTYATTAWATALGLTGAPLAAKVVDFTNPVAASTTAVHAALAGTAAVIFPGPFANPPQPRNVTATFAAAYDAGNIVVVGTDQFDQPITETIVASAGSTVAGVKIFKTVTSATKGAVGAAADAVSLGYGVKLGLPVQFTVANVLRMDPTPPVFDASTIDTTYFAFSTAGGLDGAKDYRVWMF